jgi:pimeloyl-ACP methyl ester carboxylesterase
MKTLRLGYADTALGQVHYAEAGSGDPLVLLPGSARSYRQFLPLLDSLSPDFRVIAIDTLGYGASAPLPPGGSINTLAECVAGTLDALGIARAHVFGIHTGHKVAAALAANWPDRVERVILAGKTHSIIPDQKARNDFILRRLRIRTHLHDVGPDVKELSLEDWTRVFRSISAFWWTDALLNGDADSATIDAVRLKIIDELDSIPCTGAIYHANFQFDFTEAASRIQAPCLVLEITHPSEDAAVGRQGAHLAAVIPGARLALLPSVDEAGLTCNADTAELTRCIRDFLTA